MKFKKFKHNQDTEVFTTAISFIICVISFWYIKPHDDITLNVIGCGLFTMILKGIIEFIFFE